MRIFARFGQLINDTSELKLEIEKIKCQLSKQGENIAIVFKLLDKLLDKTNKPRKEVGFKLPK